METSNFMFAFERFLGVVKTPKTIGFNVIPPVITPTDAKVKLSKLTNKLIFFFLE